MRVIELQQDISLEQYKMVYDFLKSHNIKAKEPTLVTPKVITKKERPFNYDLERMKDRVENQTFHTMPSHIKSFDDFDKWLTEVAQS